MDATQEASLKDVVAALVTKCNAQLADTDTSLEQRGGDIDIFFDQNCVEVAITIMQKEGYVIERTSYSVVARRYVSGVLEVLDCIYDISYLEILVGKPILKRECFNEIIRNSHLEKILRYRLLNKKHKVEVTDPNIIRAINTCGHMTIMTSSGNLRFSVWCLVLLGRIRQRIARIGSGKIIAVVGPDGAGKSTIINTLKGDFDMRIKYMGEYWFVGQWLYDVVMKLPLPFARIVQVPIFIHQWVRYLGLFILALLGHVVCTDRWPGTNRPLTKQGWTKNAYLLLYRLFPHPHVYVLIHASGERVHQRKQELKVEEIELLTAQLMALVRPHKHLCIENIDLDASLNQFVRLLVEGKQ